MAVIITKDSGSNLRSIGALYASMKIKNIQIPNELHQQIKLLAVQKGITIRVWVADTLQAAIKRKRK